MRPHIMHNRFSGLLIILLSTLATTGITACDKFEPAEKEITRAPVENHAPEISREVFEPQLLQALAKMGLDRSALVLPHVPYPVSTPARMTLVDRSLTDPPSMVSITRRLVNAKPRDPRHLLTGKLLEILGLDSSTPTRPMSPVLTIAELNNHFVSFTTPDIQTEPPPTQWTTKESAGTAALTALLYETILARRAWEHAGGKLSLRELQSIQSNIAENLEYRGKKPGIYRLMDSAYHSVGARFDIEQVAVALTGMLATIEQSLPALQQAATPLETGEWMTPLGRVKVAGTGNDHHKGEFLLLIDAGGDDTYENVTAPFEPGGISIVLDLGGNDTVTWNETIGPGTGVLGLSVWVNSGGNDHYDGGNLGLGVGILGGGLLWDTEGDDSYMAHAVTQGMGKYGIGLLFDDSGDDRYQAAFNGQGYGESGGIGMLVDYQGNDDYACGNHIPDPVKARSKRHLSTRYLSMCQGFGFGARPKISGGIGVLLDNNGNDHYKADIFGQGAGYWFGLGLLVDGAGNDHYEAFEHCQGEAVHLAAGSLVDWGGNDHYECYEDAQGAGKDRGAGVLYDEAGNDVYIANQKSQGAGLSSYGVGLLIDRAGDDHYRAELKSQGYAGPDLKFPEAEWPTGILLDYGGKDVFHQPFSAAVDKSGRIYNRQGIAIQYETLPK